YSPNPFVSKLERFEYSVGSVQRIAQKANADAVLLSYGFDEISTGGRKALHAVGTVLPFVPRVSAGATGLCAALVDPAGTILWYNIEPGGGGAARGAPRGPWSFARSPLVISPRVEKGSAPSPGFSPLPSSSPARRARSRRSRTRTCAWKRTSSGCGREWSRSRRSSTPVARSTGTPSWKRI